MARRDLLSRLADAGEEAISRLSDTPGADRLLGVANTMRDRIDELQKKVRGIDELEKRVAALERRLDAQGRSTAGGRAPGRRAGAATTRKTGTTAARKTAAARKTGTTARKTTSTAKKSAATRRTTGTRRTGGSTGRTGGTSPG